jgi:hypothetical protein
MSGAALAGASAATETGKDGASGQKGSGTHDVRRTSAGQAMVSGSGGDNAINSREDVLDRDRNSGSDDDTDYDVHGTVVRGVRRAAREAAKTTGDIDEIVRQLTAGRTVGGTAGRTVGQTAEDLEEMVQRLMFVHATHDRPAEPPARDRARSYDSDSSDSSDDRYAGYSAEYVYELKQERALAEAAMAAASEPTIGTAP